MAENKNQHFVHQGYLRPFSFEGNSGAIAIFNIVGQKYVPTGSIRRECSKRYFYGKDPWYEHHMQNIEGTYNTVIRRICAHGYKLTDNDRKFLLRFWMFQYSRTEAAAKEGIEMADVMANAFDIPDEHNDFDPDKAIEIALGAFLHHRDQLDDLKVRLIKNKTKYKFITSDNPAVLCNRWYVSDPRPRRLKFGGGVGSSGTVLLLPLTPSLLFIAFDGDVYNMTHKNNWVILKSKRDVSSFNELQYLNSFRNVYCVDEPNGKLVAQVSKALESNRRKNRYAVEYMVEEGSTKNEARLAAIMEDGTRLVEASEDEAREIGKGIFRHRRIFPLPQNWPSILKFRINGSVYSNGSYGGFKRRRHADMEMRRQPDLVFWRENSNYGKL